MSTSVNLSTADSPPRVHSPTRHERNGGRSETTVVYSAIDTAEPISAADSSSSSDSPAAVMPPPTLAMPADGGCSMQQLPVHVVRMSPRASPRGSFTGGHSRAASRASLYPPNENWSVVSLSFRLGALLLLFFWLLWDCIVDTKLRPSNNNFWIDAVLPVYRATGFLLLAYWMWGMNVYFWKKYRINYLFLFELHPRTSDTHRQIFSNATTLSIVYLANFLLYFKMERGDFPAWFPAGVWPAGMFILIVLVMIPWPGCGTPIKQWPIAFGEVLLAPTRPVKFLHVFIGDVLTSLVKPGIDIAYSLCFLFTGLFLDKTLSDNDAGNVCLNSFALTRVLTPIISALPLWLRMLQCLRRYHDTHERFPHMVNAGKYATASSVVLVGVFHASMAKAGGVEQAAWVITLSGSTLYSYFWDVLMDWDLWKKNHSRLRQDLIYPNRAFYYVAIVLDLFFRFAWALTFVPTDASPFGVWFHQALNPVSAGCEIVRRGVWALIRVENEHLTQITSFQRLHDASEQMLPEEYLEDEEEEAQLDEEARTTTRGWVLLAEIVVLVAIVLTVALVSYFTH